MSNVVMAQRTKAMLDGPGHSRASLVRGKLLPHNPTMFTTSRESLESHLMAFAAEEARVEGSILHMDDYRRRAEAVTQ